MEKNETLQFQQFISKAVLQDQTQLINVLLNGEKRKKLQHSIHNRVVYDVTISDEVGKVSITTPVLQFYITRWEEDIRGLLKNLMTCKSQEEREKLKTRLKWLYADRQNMSTAPKRERTVYQWLLVPFWLGELLITYGEVVFRHFDCSWWGISSLLKEQFKQDAVLYDVFTELKDSPEHSGNIDNS